MDIKKLSLLENHVGYLMRIVSNSVSGSFSNKLHDIGISIAEWAIMRIMFDYQTITHTRIVEISGLTKGAITKTLTKLLKKGLIQKAGSETDARSQILSLSKKARKWVLVISEISDHNEEEYFSMLSDKEKQALKKTLKKIIQTKNIAGIPTN